MTELYQQTASAVIKKLKSGEVSIQDTLNAMQSRIAAVDNKINALPTLCFERAAEHAKQLQVLPVEQRGQLCGLPVTIKDLTDVEGVRTTKGSAVLKDHIPASSNTLVERIESRGGVIYAKSNTPEFGMGGITFNDVFGITRSPYNQKHASGGSSGGSAASLASGTAWLSHGSDMAGSLRTPASFCGVTSLRPSPGTIDASPASLPFDVLGADGPMARNITDLALFADVMRNGDSTELQDALIKTDADHIKQLRVAVSHDLKITTVADDVSSVFESFIDTHLTDAAHLQQDEPSLTDVHSSFDALRAQFYATNLEPIFEENKHLMKPEAVWNTEQGLKLSSADLRNALRAQGAIVNGAARFMLDYDVLVCPAVSLSSVSADIRYPGEGNETPMPEYYRWLAIAYASTMMTLPVITVPIGQKGDGVPFGIQLIGKPYGEAALFQIAKSIEQRIGRNLDPVELT